MLKVIFPMIQHDCGTSMVYTQTFESSVKAKSEASSLINAVGKGVRIDSTPVTGGHTEIRATFNCRAYRNAGGSCLLQALDAANISVPRTIRPSCHPQLQPQLA